jgi:hypothetical protein
MCFHFFTETNRQTNEVYFVSLCLRFRKFCSFSDILDKCIQNDRVKKQGSHSQNLRRVRLGLSLIKALFEQFLDTEYVSLHSTKREHISSLKSEYFVQDRPP